MITDDMRARMHTAICMYASLTAEELALAADVTEDQAKEYKREQKKKILAAASVDEDASRRFHISRLKW